MCGCCVVRVFFFKQKTAYEMSISDWSSDVCSSDLNLVKADAATRKQLDDIDALIEKLEKQIAATRQEIELSKSAIATQNRGILSEQTPLEVKDRKSVV